MTSRRPEDKRSPTDDGRPDSGDRWAELAEKLAAGAPDDIRLAEDLAILACEIADTEERNPRRIGRYELVREIGQGGQGRVFLARDVELDRPVAVKILARSADLGERRRQRREGEFLARIDDARICKVFEIGESPLGTFVAMQFVAGESLASRIARHDGDGPVTLTEDGRESIAARRDRVLGYVETVARAIGMVHGLGILHRDLKPGNLMVLPDGQPMVLDFGLARSDLGDLETLTAATDIIGTPAYMAPELFGDEPPAPHAGLDVWALGVVLWECLCGSRPFYAPSRTALVERIRAARLPDLRRALPGSGPELRLVIATALERDPNRRYASAAEFADDLARIRRREPILARPVGPFLRAWRSIQRRPVTTTAVFLGTLLFTVTPTAVAVEASRARDRIAAERERAEENADLALRAVEGLLIGFGKSTSALATGDVEVRRSLLEAADRLLGELDVGPRPGVRLLTRAVTIEYELGKLEQSLRDSSRVLPRLRRVLELLGRIRDEPPESWPTNLQRLETDTRGRIGEELRRSGDRAGALAELDAAIAGAREDVGMLGTLLVNRSRVEQDSGDDDRARDDLVAAAEALRTAIEARAPNAREHLRMKLAEARMLRGVVDVRGSRFEDAIEATDEVVALVQDRASDARDVGARHLLVTALLVRAKARQCLDHLDAATADAVHALDSLRETRTIYPNRADLRATEIAILDVAASVALRTGRAVDAGRLADSSLELLAQESGGGILSLVHARGLAASFANLARTLHDKGGDRIEAAIRCYRASLAIADEIQGRFPSDVEHVPVALLAAQELAEILADRNGDEAALEVLAAAEARFTQADGIQPVIRMLRHGYRCTRAVASHLERLGRAEDAIAARERSLELGRRLAGNDPFSSLGDRAEYEADRARTRIAISIGDWERAIGWAERGLPAYQRYLSTFSKTGAPIRWDRHPVWVDTEPLTSPETVVEPLTRMRFALLALRMAHALPDLCDIPARRARGIQRKYRERAGAILRATLVALVGR